MRRSLGLKEALAEAQETGAIWGDRWWLAPQWREQIRLTDEEIRRLFAVLEETFTPDWVRSLGTELHTHPVIQYLYFEESIAHIESLLSLARTIEAFRGRPGFARVLTDYKSIRGATSAQLELLIAHTMERLGFEVVFIVPRPRKGKTPDLLVKRGPAEFTIECKSLAIEAHKWMTNYEIGFSLAITKAIPPDLAFHFDHFAAEVEPPKGASSGDVATATEQGAAAALPILKVLAELVCTDDFPVGCSIPGVGELWLGKETETHRTSFQVPELSQVHLLKRLFTNGVNKANRQIAAYEGYPGIAAVFQWGPPDYGEIRGQFLDLLARDPTSYRDLMGLLVLPAGNLLSYVAPLWVENPVWSERITEWGLRELLHEGFRPMS